MRRIHDLRLQHAETPLFVVTWTALHRIDEQSPLHGETAESLAASDAELVVTLVGVDDVSSSAVYARHSYLAHEIVFGMRFADGMSRLPDGRFQVDFSRFDDVVPLTFARACRSGIEADAPGQGARGASEVGEPHQRPSGRARPPLRGGCVAQGAGGEPPPAAQSAFSRRAASTTPPVVAKSTVG